MKSWRTTIAGAALIIAGCYALARSLVDPTVGAGLIAAGLGLVSARGCGVTSEQAGAK